MRRPLVYTGRFTRASKRLLKRHPELAVGLKSLFVAMGEDVFQASLHTHKLKGNLADCGHAAGGST